MLLKDIYYVEVWQPLFQQNHLCNFGREYHEGQFCEIILAAPLFDGVEPFVQIW